MELSSCITDEQRKRYIEEIVAEMKELMQSQRNTDDQNEKDRLEKRIRELFDRKLFLETR